MQKANAFEAQQRSGSARIRASNRNIRRYRSTLVRHKEEEGKGAASDKFKLAKNIEVLAQSTQESNVALDSRKKEYEKKWEGVEKKYDAEKAKLMSASSA